MFNLLTDPLASKVVGGILIVLGFSFAYKTYLAFVKGRVLYWQGWLPVTIFSPWFVHVPPKNPEKSLSRYKEAGWVPLVVGPLFLGTTILSLAAGADLTGLPGTKTLNYALTGGKPGASEIITFDPRSGFHAPGLKRAVPALDKIFGKPLDLKPDQQMYEKNGQSYDQTK